MMRAFVVVAVPLMLWACGGEATGEKPPQTAGDASVPAAEPPADPTAKTDAASDTGAGDAKPEGDAKPAAKGDDEGWAGESEAKAQKAPEGGKAETRTMEVIAQVIKDNRKGVRDCFDKAKKDLPDLKGDMVIHFVIDPDGKVKKADLNQERSTLKSPAVVDCSIKVLQAIKFPPSSRGMDTTVNYPFNLN
jgi:hypothetical protein